MRFPLASRAISVLLVYLLGVSVVAQQGPVASEATRPRRTQPSQPKTTGTPDSPSKIAAGANAGPDQWKITPRPIVPIDSLARSANSAEPTIRVALATDVRSATISSTARLMSATDIAQTFVPLDVARVRVDSHLLSPLPATKQDETFRLKLAGFASRAEADDQAKAIRESTAEESQAVFDVETQTWGLLVGSRRSHDDAEEARARLEAAGFAATLVDLRPDGLPPISAAQPTTSPSPLKNADGSFSKTVSASPAPGSQRGPGGGGTLLPQTSATGVRLASRSSLPTRELVAFASTGKLFSSSAPVTFASDDEAKAPVRFNEKPFRGHIEVFANPRGMLTVVNVLGLEDYVRGVVANELSPGGYPAIEAMKAQAIAARTYALRNRGQFAAQGFDLLPSTRSQVYRGLTSENPLSTRAVDETRGVIATYNGEPINALYTSTCGGRTEDAENIFNQAVPYLRGRECAVEGRTTFGQFTIKTSRQTADVLEEKNLPLAREVALLTIQNFSSLVARVSDSWLAAEASVGEIQNWLAGVARLSHQVPVAVPPDANRPPTFATYLSRSVYGESRADTLLNNADVEYFLAIRDAAEVPVNNRADVALLIRDGYLPLFPDLTLRPKQTMSRGRALHTIARLLESRGLLQIQKGMARPSGEGTLILRPGKGKDQPLRVTSDLYLFQQIGESVYPVHSVAIMGGEPVLLHLNASGVVDYLEVHQAPNGAAADRFSPFTNWTTELSLGQVQARLARDAHGIGRLVDLRVAGRGTSRRVTDLELVGTDGTAHVRGGKIRSALGLKEQLFVIERKYDAADHVSGFVFTGRGWGHGVGMCQVGAYGLARQGWSYEQILRAYYTGIELTRIY